MAELMNRRWQTKAREYMRARSLPVSAVWSMGQSSTSSSQTIATVCPGEIEAGRDTQIFLNFMAVDTAIVTRWADTQGNPVMNTCFVGFYDSVNGTFTENKDIDVPLTNVDDSDEFRASTVATILAYANGVQGYGLTEADIIGTLSPVSAAPLSFANPTRSLNSAFQVSTTRAAQVSYSVDVACSATLLGGQTGTVFLEYADDSGFTTNVKEVARQVNGNSVSLAIAITANQNVTATVGGIIPAGKYVRLRTQNNTGTPTFTFRSAQEVLLASN